MLKYDRLSGYKKRKIMECYCLDFTATASAKLLGINRKTVNRYYNLFRRAIFLHQSKKFNRFYGTIEVDESYFGATRPRGKVGPRKRGRGTNKQPVFGILKRNGEVYTEIVPDVKKRTLQRIIRQKISKTSDIVSDGWPGYDGLVDMGYNRHYRVNHSKNFSCEGTHINGIESFWSFVKRRLTKFNGTGKAFKLHLKECEWRWKKDYPVLLKSLSGIFKKVPRNQLEMMV